jgi:hypothetical protein
VDILVETAYHKDLVVILDWVRAKEFLWLLESTVLTLNLIRLRVEAKAVRNPAIITSEN